MGQKAFAKSIARIEARAQQDSDDARIYYERALRRRAENHAVSLEARFQALMAILPQAVLVIDGRTGMIKGGNDYACHLFGYTMEKLLSISVEELVPVEIRAVHPAYRLGFLRSVRKREMGYHPPIFGVRADGTKIEMAIALTATTADDDVMVVCSEYFRWKVAADASKESEVAVNG